VTEPGFQSRGGKFEKYFLGGALLKKNLQIWVKNIIIVKFRGKIIKKHKNLGLKK